MLEGCYGPCNGSDTSLILSDWEGVSGTVYISGGAVASQSFGGIASLPQTNMAWLVRVFWK